MTTNRMTIKGAYADVNGLELYFELHGEAHEGTDSVPRVLLHGGLGSLEMFASALPRLAQGRQVIAVDLQAHGHTADIDRPLSYEAMADDIAALIKELGFAQADIMGYSLGGVVGMRTAVQHPDLVRKLIVVSAAFRRSGSYPEVLAAMEHVGPALADAMKPSPIYQHYARVAPRPEDWPRLLGKVGELLRRDYDYSSDVAALSVPTLLVFGDGDSAPPAHAVAFFELLGGGRRDGGLDRSGLARSRLAILPGATHYEMLERPDLMAVVMPFLESPLPT